MVVKIQQGAASCRTPVGYNERKVAQGLASVVGVHAMSGDSLACVLRTFDALEGNPAISARTGSLAFHLSVNPAPGEHLTQENTMEFISQIMEALGYGEQPYIVYRHNDTSREHFHVVSVRADKNGRIISDSFSRRVLQKALQQICPWYGFTIGSAEKKTDMTPPSQQESLHESSLLERFSTQNGNNAEQLRHIFLECLQQYCFSTREQLGAILSHYGVRLIERRGPTAHMGALLLQGLSPDGAPYGRPITGRAIGVDISKEIEKKISKSKTLLRSKHQERSRVASIARSCLGYSTSEVHFQRMLENKDISAVIYRTDGIPTRTTRTSPHPSPTVFGVTYIDHAGKCAFSSSELPFCEKIGPAALQQMLDSGKWKSEEGKVKIGEEDKASQRNSSFIEERKQQQEAEWKDILPALGSSLLSGPDGTGSREQDIPAQKKKKKKSGISF